MPSYRGITISCQSQYDCCTIVEEPLPNASVRNLSSLLDADTVPTPCFRVNDDLVNLRDPSIHVAEVEIPVYPGSQFWLSYTCPPPAGADFRFWYFKLLVGGECLVSWGVGDEEDYSGKTMFALYDGGTDFEGRKVIAKRGFFFPNSSEAEYGGMEDFEIQVFRSQARRREKAVYEKYHEPAETTRRISAASIGRLSKGEPRRQYAYALLDPVDRPYATFRYYFQAGAKATSPASSQASTDILSPQQLDEVYSPKEEVMTTMPPVRRLSVPPRADLKLHLPKRQAMEPASPGHDTGDESSGPAAHVSSSRGGSTGISSSSHDWAVRTPSPVKVDQISSRRSATPPSARANNGSVSLLRGVIANALKRRDGSGSSDGLVG